MTTIADYLRTAPSESTRRDYEVVIATVLDVGRAHLYAHGDDDVSHEVARRIEDGLTALRGGTPVAYVVGRQAFWSLTLDVTTDVLIPRPDTELVVELALAQLTPGARVLDLGTGSGAIALAIKHTRPDCVVLATDVSSSAAEIARRNAAKLELEIEIRVGDWFVAVDDGELFDVIVSNPPYVRFDDPHLNSLVGEPRLALLAGIDGLDALRIVVREAHARLGHGGVLIVEHGYDQGLAVRGLFSTAGYRAIATHRDAGARERATLGWR